MISSKLVFILIISTFWDIGTSAVLECDQNADCIAADATCVERICECPKGKVFSIDGTRCLDVSVGYESSCEEDPQCSWLLGKHTCSNRKCVCASGYRYYHGKCIVSAGLGESCTKNEECHVSNDFNAMICMSGSCTCNNGYYARANHDCRPIAQADGDSCAIDSDCQYEGGYCNSGKCATSGRRATLEKTTPEKSDSHSATKQEETSRAGAQFLSAVGDECTSNDECDVENSYCSPITQKCTCERGYYLNKQLCVPELGMEGSCSTSSDCTSPSICEDNRCVCPVTHVHTNALDKCQKAAVSPDFFCTTDIACQVMGDAKCVEVNILDSVCECPLGWVLNDKINLCVKEEGSCAAECTENEDCESSIINSVCNTSTGECRCPTNYRLEDDICLPNLGAACDHVTKKCEMENSECYQDTAISSICRCKANYYQLDDVTCVEMVSIGGDCNLDIQCTSLDDNSKCLDGKCQCLANHVLLENHCFPERSAGEYCINPLQCKNGDNSDFQCRNSICQCPANMEPTNDGKHCKQRSSSSSIFVHFSTISLIVSILSFYLLWL